MNRPQSLADLHKDQRAFGTFLHGSLSIVAKRDQGPCAAPHGEWILVQKERSKKAKSNPNKNKANSSVANPIVDSPVTLLRGQRDLLQYIWSYIKTDTNHPKYFCKANYLIDSSLVDALCARGRVPPRNNRIIVGEPVLLERLEGPKEHYILRSVTQLSVVVRTSLQAEEEANMSHRSSRNERTFPQYVVRVSYGDAAAPTNASGRDDQNDPEEVFVRLKDRVPSLFVSDENFRRRIHGYVQEICGFVPAVALVGDTVKLLENVDRDDDYRFVMGFCRVATERELCQRGYRGKEAIPKRFWD